MADVKYTNLNKQNGSSGYYDQYGRRKLSNVEMWNKNPYYMLGNMIGQAIFEPYFEKKRAKSESMADFFTNNKAATKDQFEKYYDAIKNGYSPTEALQAAGIGVTPTAPVPAGGDTSSGKVLFEGRKDKTFDDMTKALDKVQNGKVLYSGKAEGAPRRPQDVGQKPITSESTGMKSPGETFKEQANGVTYNPGSTPVINPTGGSVDEKIPEPATPVNNGLLSPAPAPAPVTTAPLTPNDVHLPKIDMRAEQYDPEVVALANAVPAGAGPEDGFLEKLLFANRNRAAQRWANQEPFSLDINYEVDPNNPSVMDKLADLAGLIKKRG